MEEYSSYAVALGLGLGAMVIVTITSTIYGWKRNQPFYVEPRFSIFSPLVTVTWESRRFGDWIALLRFSGLCALCAAGYFLVELKLAISFGVGAILGMIFPQLGNFVIGIMDRYEIEPRTPPVAPKPGPKPKHRSHAQPQPTSESTSTPKPERPPAKPKSTTGGGWRSE